MPCQLSRSALRGTSTPSGASGFNGITIEHLASGESLLATGPIDQAKLHALLNPVCDLNLTLLSVDCQEATKPAPRGPDGQEKSQ